MSNRVFTGMPKIWALMLATLATKSIAVVSSWNPPAHRATQQSPPLLYHPKTNQLTELHKRQDRHNKVHLCWLYHLESHWLTQLHEKSRTGTTKKIKMQASCQLYPSHVLGNCFISRNQHETLCLHDACELTLWYLKRAGTKDLTLSQTSMPPSPCAVSSCFSVPRHWQNISQHSFTDHCRWSRMAEELPAVTNTTESCSRSKKEEPQTAHSPTTSCPTETNTHYKYKTDLLALC